MKLFTIALGALVAFAAALPTINTDNNSPNARDADTASMATCDALCIRYKCCIGGVCPCGGSGGLASLPLEDMNKRSPVAPFEGAIPGARCRNCPFHHCCWRDTEGNEFCNCKGSADPAAAMFGLDNIPSTSAAAERREASDESALEARPGPCDIRCRKYGCCQGSFLCRCRAAELDAFEAEEKLLLQGKLEPVESGSDSDSNV